MRARPPEYPAAARWMPTLWGVLAAPLCRRGPARARDSLRERLDPPPTSLSRSLLSSGARRPLDSRGPAAIHQFQRGAITTSLLAPPAPLAGTCHLQAPRSSLAWISHTSVMVTGLKVGGDVEQALENVGVPSYVLDKTGVVRWLNTAAERLLGDVRGRHFTSVVAPEDSRRARELFAQKVLGTPRPPRRPASWSRPPGHGWPWRSARCRSEAANGWSASSGCSKDTPTVPQRHPRISPPAKSRYCGSWSRAAQRSKLPRSST